jgi:hypothetical protein
MLRVHGMHSHPINRNFKKGLLTSVDVIQIYPETGPPQALRRFSIGKGYYFAYDRSGKLNIKIRQRIEIL